MRFVWESVREQERGACAGLTVGRVGQSLIERGCVAGCASASILRRGGLCMHKLARAVWTCVALLLTQGCSDAIGCSTSHASKSTILGM